MIRSSKQPLPDGPQAPMHKDRIALLSAGHFINDIYPGFVPALMPLLMTKLAFGLPLAGVIMSSMSLFNSFAQPVFGHIADKTRYPWLVTLGPMTTALFMCLVGLAPRYEILLVLVILSGLGTAAFHPQAAVYTSHASGRRSGMGMSVFITGGSAGHALGPMIIIPIVTAFGLAYSTVTVVFGLVISVALFYSLPALQHTPHRHSTEDEVATAKSMWHHKTIIHLWVIVTARAFIIVGFISFLPIFLHDKAFSLFVSGASITVFELSGAVGAFIGGSLSDFLGRKRVIIYSLLLSLPFLYLFVQTGNVMAFVFLAIAGLFIYGSIPVVILMAQELYPKRINTVSSLMMGVSWGLGGLLMTPMGIFADKYGIKAAFFVLLGIGLATSVAAFFLPETRKPVTD